MESSQLKRISIIGVSILCLSPVEIFSNKLFENNKEINNIEIAEIVKLEPNYLSNNYEIFNPNIKVVSENLEQLTNENKKKEISDSENNLESETTSEENLESKDEEVVVEKVVETSTSTTKNQVKEKIVEKEVTTVETTMEPEVVEEQTEVVTPPNTEVATSLINFAKQYVGYPYKSGGTDLNTGVDCSGFTMKVFEQFGYSLPHASKSQVNYGTYVSLDNLAAGDLIFYGYNGSISHVAIYIGDGQIIHATTNTGGIKIASYQMMPIITARRILN